MILVVVMVVVVVVVVHVVVVVVLVVVVVVVLSYASLMFRGPLARAIGQEMQQYEYDPTSYARGKMCKYVVV